MIIQFARDPGEFERALHHPERRVAVAVHDPVGKRTVIRADAHGAPVLLAKLDQRREPLADPLQLRRVLLVRVFENLELLRVGVIAGIDPDLLHPFRGFHGRLRLEMDVGHDRHLAAALAQPGDDVLQIRRVFHRRRGDPHDLAAGFSQLECLRDRRLGVHRVARDHRLDADRVRPADADLADHHLARRGGVGSDRANRSHRISGSRTRFDEDRGSVAKNFRHALHDLRGIVTQPDYRVRAKALCMFQHSVERVPPCLLAQVGEDRDVAAHQGLQSEPRSFQQIERDRTMIPRTTPKVSTMR